MQEEKGWLTNEFMGEDEMRRGVAQRLGVPFVLLTKDDIFPEALVLIPEPLSRAHSAVAYNMGGSVVEVALVDMADLEKVSALVLQAGKKIKPRLTNQASIKQALMVYQKHLKDAYGAALQAGNADALILHALQNQASDIHLDVVQGGTRIRYRIQGALHEAMRLSSVAGAALVQSVKSLAKLFPIAAVQEGKCKVERDGEVVLVSVANIPGVDGERLTLRLAREHAGHQGFTLSALGLHGKALEQTHALLHAHSGLVLVSGPHGSGKTTTLYTLLDQLEGSDRSVATIEDTIEHRVPYAMQTQTRSEVGLTMLAGLRAVLRNDPDIVLVGTIDNAEVAQLALEAAGRGVLVFAAMEARSASGAIAQLVEWGIAPHLLATALRGVVSTRLANKIIPNSTRIPQKLSHDEAALLEGRANFGRVLAALKEEGHVESGAAWKDVVFYKDAPSQGFVGIQEVLTVTAPIKEMIMQDASANDLEQDIEIVARQEGMGTLVEDALGKAAQGLVGLEEALEVASE